MQKHLIFIIIITVGLGFSLFSCTKKPDAEKNPNVSNDSTQNVSPQQMLASLNNQIARDGKNYLLYRQRAETYHALDSIDKAIADIETAIKLSQSDSIADLRYLRGFFAYTKGDTADAMTHLQQAQKINYLDNPEIPYQIGQIFLQQKKYGDAEKYFTMAAKMDSLAPIYVFAKGFLNEQQGKTKEAIRYYNESVKLDTTFVKGYAQLFYLYSNVLRDADKAAEYNRKILKINPSHPLANFNRAKKLWEEGKKMPNEAEMKKTLSLAIAAYSDAIDNDSLFVQAYYERGYCYFMIDNETNAIKDFEKVIALDSKNYQAYFMLGSIYEHYKDKNMAVSYYSKALEVKPDFTEAGQAVQELRGTK